MSIHDGVSINTDPLSGARSATTGAVAASRIATGASASSAIDEINACVLVANCDERFLFGDSVK
jgi:acetyltransferase-like isoleucine patch superfamily enzyme